MRRTSARSAFQRRAAHHALHERHGEALARQPSLTTLPYCDTIFEQKNIASCLRKSVAVGGSSALQPLFRGTNQLTNAIIAAQTFWNGLGLSDKRAERAYAREVEDSRVGSFCVVVA